MDILTSVKKSKPRAKLANLLAGYINKEVYRSRYRDHANRVKGVTLKPMTHVSRQPCFGKLWQALRQNVCTSLDIWLVGYHRSHWVSIGHFSTILSMLLSVLFVEQIRRVRSTPWLVPISLLSCEVSKWLTINNMRVKRPIRRTLPSWIECHDHKSFGLRQRCQCCIALVQFEQLALLFVSQNRVEKSSRLSDRHHILCAVQCSFYDSCLLCIDVGARAEWISR